MRVDRRRGRWPIAQRTVRPHGVVVLPPPLNHHPGLPQAVEDLSIEQFIPQPPVETLAIAVLPRTTGLDVERSGTHRRQPCPQRLGGELRTVVRADVIRHPAHQHDICQGFDHHLRPDTALHADRQGLPGVFVDQAEQAHRPTIMRPSGHEVIAPDVVRTLRPQPNAAPVVQPQPAPGPLLARHLQRLPAPDMFYPVTTHPQATAIDHDRDPAIAIATILAGEADDALGQQILIGPEDGPIALCAPGLAEDAASTALRDAVTLNGLCHRLPSPLGA